MPHGQPDFGMYTLAEDLYRLTDMAELAARLGALSRYDRVGDLIASEDFTGDMGAWKTEISGTGSEVVVTAERFISGGFSCRMTAGSDASRYAGIRMLLPVPYTVIYGIEIAWTMSALLDYAYVRVDIYTGVWHLAFGIKYDATTQLNYYYNAAGGWTAIPGIVAPLFDDHNFIVTKFTFNVSAVAYSRLKIPSRSFDLSGDSGFVFPDAVTKPHMELSGRIYSTLGNNARSYVDSLILTANDV